MLYLIRAAAIMLAVAMGVGVVASAPAWAGVEGVSYTFTPSYEVIQWDDDLGLEDTQIYGGRLGLEFGKYLRLEGYYLGRSNVDTDLGNTGLFDNGSGSFSDQEIDLSSYGGSLVFNLSRGPVVPFVRTGGGILRFKDEADNDFRQINLRAGGGLRFGIDRYTAELFVEDSAFRIDRYDLVPGDGVLPEDPDADDIRHNLTFGVGLNFRLGGYEGRGMTDTDRAIMERYRSGLRGLSIPIEPFAGRLDFNDDLGLDEQELIGVRAGFDLGPYFGLRGYYWHGVGGDFDRTDPIQSWGGEAQFNLSSGQGVVPFLVAGVGQLDFKDDYFVADSLDYSDKTVLILGGGIAFNLSDRLRMQVSGRNYLFSESAADDVRGTDDVHSNLMLSAGLRFSFGGADAPRPRMPEVPVMSEAGAAPADETPAAAPVEVETEVLVEAPVVHEAEASVLLPNQTLSGERIIPIPVPLVGELYVRYGQPGGVTINSEGRYEPVAPVPDPSAAAPMGAGQEALTRDALRLLLRDELDRMGMKATPEAPAAPTSPPAPTTPADPTPPTAPTGDLSDAERMELMEMRVAERVGERMEKALREEMAKMRGEGQPGPTTVVITDDGETRTVEGEPGTGTVIRTEVQEPYHWKPQEVSPYLGVNVDSPEQGLFGARVNLGPVTRDSKFKLVPELAFGFGSDGTSYLLAGNLRYDFGSIGESGTVSPYAMVGAGLFGFDADERADTEGVINLSYGVTMKLGSRVAFIEHQGVDLFDLHRILFGMRFPW